MEYIVGRYNSRIYEIDHNKIYEIEIYTMEYMCRYIIVEYMSRYTIVEYMRLITI